MRKNDKNLFFAKAVPALKANIRSVLLIALTVIVIAVAGVIAFRGYTIVEPPRTVTVEEKNEITIYHPSPRATLVMKSVPVEANLTNREKADTIVANLHSLGVIPETVLLVDISSDLDGMLILNFTPQMTAMNLDPLMEIHAVYSIVNSFLANFTHNRSVQLLAGGQAFFTPGGTVYTYKPMEFNSHVLED